LRMKATGGGYSCSRKIVDGNKTMACDSIFTPNTSGFYITNS
jgi:hypothetical protein